MDKPVTAAICTLPRRVDQTGSPERLLSSGGPQKRSLPPLEIRSLNKLRRLLLTARWSCAHLSSQIFHFLLDLLKGPGESQNLGEDISDLQVGGLATRL